MPSGRDSFRRNRVAPNCTSILPFLLFLARAYRPRQGILGQNKLPGNQVA